MSNRWPVNPRKSRIRFHPLISSHRRRCQSGARKSNQPYFPMVNRVIGMSNINGSLPAWERPQRVVIYRKLSDKITQDTEKRPEKNRNCCPRIAEPNFDPETWNLFSQIIIYLLANLHFGKHDNWRIRVCWASQEWIYKLIAKARRREFRSENFLGTIFLCLKFR